MSLIADSKTPWVDGYVIMADEMFPLCFAIYFFRSSTSMLPLSSDLIGTTFMPHMTAVAGFVP